MRRKHVQVPERKYPVVNMLFPFCSFKCLLVGRGQRFKKFMTSLCLSVCVCMRGAVCRGRLYVCEYCAFMSLTIFRIFCVYFIDLNTILIYPHISSDTSIYWSFRHLQACGCLINSLLVWFDYLYSLPPPLFFKRITWLAVRMAPNLIIHLQPLSTLSASLNVTLFIPILCLKNHLWSPFTEQKYGQADKAED